MGYPPVRSILGVPLLDRVGAVRGALLLGHADPDQFTTEDQTILLILAGQAALALENFRLYQQAQLRSHDVAERRLHEAAALRAQERTSYLEAIFEAMVDGVYVYDQEGHIVQMNSAARAQLERVAFIGAETYGLEERLGGVTIIGAEGQPLTSDQWPNTRMLRGERFPPEHAVELQMPMHDGRVLYTSDTGGPICDAEGQIIGAVAISRDVTERKLAEQALQQAQRQTQEYAAQLEAILEAMPDILLVYDGAGHIIRTNAAGERFLQRFGLADVTSLSNAERAQRATIYTEQGDVLPVEAWPTSRILRGETLTPENSIDLMQRDPQGNELYVSTTGGPLYDTQGRCSGGVFLAHDITERKHAERLREQQARQLRLQASLIELAHDAIIVRDSHSVILSWNQGAEALYGWSAQEAIGQVTQDLLQTRFPRSKEVVDHALQQEGQWDGELVHTCRDGRIVIVESRQALVRDASGQPTAFLGINRDVTAQRHLEQLEREAHAEAERRLTLLQLILDELPSCIYLVRGPEARLVLANRAVATFFGATWTPGQPMREFLAGHGIRILRPNGRPLEPEQIPALRVVQRGETVRQFQQVTRHPDETTLPVLVNAVLLDAAALPGSESRPHPISMSQNERRWWCARMSRPSKRPKRLKTNFSASPLMNCAPP